MEHHHKQTTHSLLKAIHMFCRRDLNFIKTDIRCEELRINPTKPFACYRCPKEYARGSDLVRHIQSNHMDSDEEDDEPGSDRLYLRLRVAVDEEELSRFSSTDGRSKITFRMQAKTSKTNPCPYCSKTYVTNANFERHLKEKHRSKYRAMLSRDVPQLKDCRVLLKKLPPGVTRVTVVDSGKGKSHKEKNESTQPASPSTPSASPSALSSASSYASSPISRPHTPPVSLLDARQHSLLASTSSSPIQEFTAEETVYTENPNDSIETVYLPLEDIEGESSICMSADETCQLTDTLN